MIRTLIVFAFLGWIAPLTACSCIPQSFSFDLAEYDRAYDVAIVNIISVTDVGKSKKQYRQERLRYDSLRASWPEGSREVIPPPPPPPLENVYVFATVETAFKDNITADTILLHAYKDAGACGWVPIAGVRYLIYLGEPEEKFGKQGYTVGQCMRALWLSGAGLQDAQQEIAVLQALRNASEGDYQAEQSVVIWDDTTKVIAFYGAFKNGLRNGKWRINTPHCGFPEYYVPNQLAYELIYVEGVLVKLGEYRKKQPGENDECRWRWNLLYYVEEINANRRRDD